jgi:hypothetical protein
MIRTAALTLSLGLLAAPLAAQDDPAPDAPAEDDSFSMMEEGARMFFRGLMSEMDPALEELGRLTEEMRPALRDFATEMGPAFRDLMTEVEDWSVYRAPEMLPNGDIIIRRREPLDTTPDDPAPESDGTEPGTGEIEL